MAEMVTVELNQPVRDEPCNIEITWSIAGHTFFSCKTHTSFKRVTKKDEKGEEHYDHVEGEELQLVCRQRIRLAFKKFLEEANIQ